MTDRAGVEDELGRVDLPTLVVVGDQDVATVPARAESIRQLIRNSTLVVLPGAGHSSAIEEPAAVNRVLEEFLSACRRT